MKKIYVMIATAALAAVSCMNPDSDIKFGVDLGVEDGVITIKNDRAAISLILTPTIENAGSYDCTWEYKGKSGISYFYPSEMPKEKPRKKNSDTSSLRNKEESHNTSNANDSTKKQNANIDSVSKKSSGVKPSLKKDNETQTEGSNVKQISE